MTLRDLNLMAGLAALATLGVVACADNSDPDMELVPSGSVSPEAPVDPATATPTPESPLPDAPPEIQADGVDVPPGTVDSTDPIAPPPGSPPPVLPETPPN